MKGTGSRARSGEKERSFSEVEAFSKGLSKTT